MLSARWVYNTVYGFKMLENSIFHLNIDKKVMVEKITNSTNNFCWKSKTSDTGDQNLLVDQYTGQQYILVTSILVHQYILDQ